MDFFDAQDNARRVSRRLVLVYLLATVLIVAGVSLIAAFALWSLDGVRFSLGVGGFLREQAGVIAGAAVLTSLLIAGATFYKIARLSSGGGRVARDIGGTLVVPDVKDPLRRRLRNVVEEMAIASGVPVPEIYVLEAESGINAFAAGYAPGDAAIAVTRGALELLDRNELQGVIGHEFSHILNGDMRLNIRLMGILFGIMVLGLIGRMILRGNRHVSIGSRRSRGVPIVLLVGLGLTLIGYIGVLLARLIKASVSRQREFLADASAVQFTRQTEGIANALKKIGGYHGGSRITAADPEEVAHMLFGSGSKLWGAFATHPPLAERIRALDPSFAEGDYPAVDLRDRAEIRDVAGLTADEDQVSSAFAEGGRRYLAEDIVDTVGQPEQEHVLYAAGIRRSIPHDLYDAAHSPDLAYLLTIALLVDRRGDHYARQISLCRERLGDDRSRIIERLYGELARIGPEFRLPLLEIAFPALKNRPLPQLSFLLDLCRRLVDIDGTVDLYEFCFLKIVSVHLAEATQPSTSAARRRHPRDQVRQAAIELLAVVADYGTETEEAGASAFAAGVATLPAWAAESRFEAPVPGSTDRLDRILDILLTLNGAGRRMLLRAVSAVAIHDRTLNVPEAELIRALCATLGLPLPPMLVHDP